MVKSYRGINTTPLGPNTISIVTFERNEKFDSRQNRIIFDAMRKFFYKMYDFLKWEVYRIVPANTGALWESLRRSFSRQFGGLSKWDFGETPRVIIAIGTKLPYARFVNYEIPENSGSKPHLRHPPYTAKYYFPKQSDPDAEREWFEKLIFRGTMEANRLFRVMVNELSRLLGDNMMLYFDIYPSHAEAGQVYRE